MIQNKKAVVVIFILLFITNSIFAQNTNYVTVLSPNGFQSWTAGSTKSILFESQGLTNVKIEYSSDKGANWIVVTNSTNVSTGSYSWTLPTVLTSNALIKITGVESAVSDVSDNSFSIVNATAANAKDYVFFAGSPTKDKYEFSWGFAKLPSTLTIVGDKAPVSSKYSLVDNYSILMNWKSVLNGDWGMIIGSNGWGHFDLSQKDTLVMSIFSETDLTSNQMPFFYLEDIKNIKGAKASLGNYISTIKANQWNKVQIPLQWFKNNAGPSDLTNFKLIYFVQNNTDSLQRTLYFDDIRITGEKPVIKTAIVVLGSSTAAGTGATTSDSSWVGRYRKYLLTKDQYSSIVNLAVGGYTTYDIMASDFAAPTGKPTPKINNNITKALTYKPAAILINLPSNDANMNYTITEQISNLKAVTKLAADQKIKVWLTTTQPRNFTVAQRANLFEVKDSILSIYKDKAVDVFSTLANLDGTIKVIYSFGDGIHLNNAGHKVIFDKFVEAKVWETITNVEEDELQIPTQFAVNQNYPNPFNPTTTIEFALPLESRVDIKIYNVLGQEIVSLAGNTYSAGLHRVVWNASRLASGMYFCRVVANGDGNALFTKTIKMMLTK